MTVDVAWLQSTTLGVLGCLRGFRLCGLWPTSWFLLSLPSPSKGVYERTNKLCRPLKLDGRCFGINAGGGHPKRRYFRPRCLIYVHLYSN